MASASGNKLRLKLIIDKKSNTVLYAEAGKNFVDFIFHIMKLPMGTAIRLLSKSKTATGTVGTLANLYRGIQTLSDTYFLSSDDKHSLLRVMSPSYGGGSDETLFLPDATNRQTPPKTYYYRCSNRNNRTLECTYYVSTSSRALCPKCRFMMDDELQFVESSSSVVRPAGGYMKEAVPYMVMDNLVVEPLSSTSIVTLMNRLKIKDFNDIEEKAVDFGFEEGVKLLKASLVSTTVLTDVFFGGEKKGAIIKQESN